MLKEIPSGDMETLFLLSPEIMCIAGPDGFFRRVNPAFRDVLGYTEDQAVSISFLELIHPDDREATQQEIAKLEAGEATLNFENRYRHIDGGYRVLSWTAMYNAKDNLIYGTARDITAERIQSDRLKQVMGAIHDTTIVARTDLNGVILDVNDNFCKISGYSKEELVGKTHKVVNSGRHSEAFFKRLWDRIKSGKTWSGMLENRKKNGDHYFVYSVITPIFDIHGNVCEFLAIRTDLTKEVMVRKELRRTLKILNETGHIAKVGGWELEVATGKLTWTDETFRILEVEKRENQSPILPEGLELFVDEHKPIIEKAVGDAINEGRPYALELQAQTAKGNIRWVYTNGKANYKDGKIVTLSGTIQDIDEQKKAEQRYELERQKSIQNAKLASLGELAASVAHEINNPLSIVYGAAQMLEEEDLSEFQERYARSIIGSCERISHIIKSLQKFSRLDVEEETAVFDFSDLIRESISLVSVRARQEDVSIEFECDADAPKVLCQEVQVEQVFVNLFNNAMDAIADLPARWIKIKLQDGADHWLVKITDCGSGIDPEFAKRIFEPFVTTKAVGKGTGLGLSITAGILKDHKAGIRLDAECPNTTFVITFPKAKNGS